jgi:hypothetical protein
MKNFYFFRLAFFVVFFADLDDAGGGVLSIFRKPSSKLNPFDLMAIDFTLLADILPLFYRHQKRKFQRVHGSGLRFQRGKARRVTGL